MLKWVAGILVLGAMLLVIFLSLWGAGVLGNSHTNAEKVEGVQKEAREDKEEGTPPTDRVAEPGDNAPVHEPGSMLVEDEFVPFQKYIQGVVDLYAGNCKRENRLTDLTEELGFTKDTTEEQDTKGQEEEQDQEEKKTFSTAEAVNSFIDTLVYINMTRNPERDLYMREAIKNRNFSSETKMYRFEGVSEPNNGAKGCFLSHMHVLGWAASAYPQGHLLVLEDDFSFDVDQPTMEKYLQRADDVCHGRWDVILLGQYVHEWQPLSMEYPEKVFRALHSTTTSGYLVHRNYLRDLLVKWHQAFVPIQNRDVFRHEDNLDQIQTTFQKKDIWIAFERSLGSQRDGISTIGHVAVHNTWKCNETYDRWYESNGNSNLLKLHPPIKWRKVALCFVATGKYTMFLPSVTHSCIKHFVKPHQLEFFIFTDDEQNLPSDYDGYPVRAYHVDRKGFPGDTLYRYHYMLKAENELKTMDNVFYMDVDYWVCNPTDTEKLLVPSGLVGTAHIHNLYQHHGNHRGTPDTNPNSTAFVKPEETMKQYFCGGFQGGASSDFLQACHTMSANIDKDDADGVTALWHDESHWNRYLLDHPPASALKQSYVFPEMCLDKTSEFEYCEKLREANITPIMIAMVKNHKKIRQ